MDSTSDTLTPEYYSTEQSGIETSSNYKKDSESGLYYDEEEDYEEDYYEEEDYDEEPLNENIIQPQTIEFDEVQILAVNIFNYAARIAGPGNPVTEEHIQKAKKILFNNDESQK